MSTPEIYLLRHGETEWNAQGRMQGRLNSPLTARGQEHARSQGRLLKAHGLTGLPVYCSPAGRTRETAALAIDENADRIQFDDRLLEIDLGEWQGRTRASLEVEFPEAFGGGDSWLWYDLCPGGEGFLGVETRARDFLAQLEGPAVLITHGITSRFLRCLAQDVPVAAFSELPGGQGNIHHVQNRVHKTLNEGLQTSARIL